MSRVLAIAPYVHDRVDLHQSHCIGHPAHRDWGTVDVLKSTPESIEAGEDRWNYLQRHKSEQPQRENK